MIKIENMIKVITVGPIELSQYSLSFLALRDIKDKYNIICITYMSHFGIIESTTGLP